MVLQDIIEILEEEASADHSKSLSYYGIETQKAYGIKLPVLRKLAKEIGKNQKLAEELWQHEYHEAKLLAGMIAEPKKFDLTLADNWVQDIYSWDVCDQLCTNLLVKTDFAWELPERWIPNEQEFVRRAGLAMIVVLRIHHKKAKDEEFEKFFPLLKEYATDERNFVKKAVNWVIRELGKRSVKHHPIMMELCEELLEMNSKCASWIARDAIRELDGEKVRARLGLL